MGVAYEDPDEGKSREIDVLAVEQAYIDSENLVTVQYEIICECKNTQWPYAFIGPPKPGNDFLQEPVGYTFPIPYFAKPLELDAAEPTRYMLVPA